MRSFFLPDARERTLPAIAKQVGRNADRMDLVANSGMLFGSQWSTFRPRDLSAQDIAHALSQICRFGGSTPRMYSVAEHALLVSSVLELLGADRLTMFVGLHHDDVEVLTGDIPRPRKTEADKEFEHRMWPDVVSGALPDGYNEHLSVATLAHIMEAPKYGVAAVDDLVLAAEMRAFWGDVLKDQSHALTQRAILWAKSTSVSNVAWGVISDYGSLDALIDEAWFPDFCEHPEEEFMRRHTLLLERLMEDLKHD